MVNDLAPSLVNLRYLQLDDPFSFTLSLGLMLRRLPRPLEALYLTLPRPQADIDLGRQFDLTSLDHHRQSLKHLALVYVEMATAVPFRDYNWDFVCEDNPLVLRTPDFTGFTRLETLELSFRQINGGWINLALPPTLKFLDIEDHESDDSLPIKRQEEYYCRRFRGYVRRQNSLLGEPKASLEAMVVHKKSNVIFVVRPKEESPKGVIGNGRVAVISREDFKQKFPDYSERYWQTNIADYRWKWMEKFV
ncbi:hypothetical protein TWF506_006476 [Arthrobotrys conoides]|uniref:Uncharacterized protein n=1 Tax=Arthrobotrys conoides TaxID=74498 RepID=A0AAN8S156_9PEZI